MSVEQLAKAVRLRFKCEGAQFVVLAYAHSREDIVHRVMIDDGDPPALSPNQVKRLHEAISLARFNATKSLNAPPRKRVPIIKPVIAAAPGFRFRRLVGYFCSKRTRDRVLEAYHAEAVQDFFDHLAKGDIWGARIVHIMMYPRMLYVVGLHKVISGLAGLAGKLAAAASGQEGEQK